MIDQTKCQSCGDRLTHGRLHPSGMTMCASEVEATHRRIVREYGSLMTGYRAQERRLSRKMEA